jgi:hypothetical protein
MIKNFSIGAEVEIQTRWKSNILGEEYQDNIFKGKVVNNPKWLDNDYVSVYTGNPEYPTSHINKRFIVGFDFCKAKILEDAEIYIYRPDLEKLGEEDV